MKNLFLLSFVILFVFAPKICTAKYSGGTGQPNDPYRIFDANDMNGIGLHQEDWNKHFVMVNDVNLARFTATQFNIIGYFIDQSHNNPFTGVFDGNGFAISNFTYISTETNWTGLFGYVSGPNAVIKDLTLIDPKVNAGIGDSVGSLVGRIYFGTITNCYAAGSSVSGDYEVGGLVGANIKSSIAKCCVIGNVNGNSHTGGLAGSNRVNGTIEGCYAVGSVDGNELTGGLVGEQSNATIRNCYATGTVDGNAYTGGLLGYNFLGGIFNSYAAASLSGTTYLGGLVGYNADGSYTKCFWDSDINPDVNSIGNTTAPDYDFSWIGHWKMNDNDDQNQVDDSSGNDNHGTAQQITSTLHTNSGNPPYLNGALTFNGTSDYIDVGEVIGIGAYTKAAWIKRAEGQFVNNIISADTFSHAFFAPNDISFRLAAGHNGSWLLVQDSVPLAVDTWYFVAVTFDPNVESGKMVLYKNGIEVDDANNVPTQLGTSTTTYIGRFESGYYFGGEMDNVMVFNRALTAEEIEFLYNEGYGIEILPDGSLDPNVIGKRTIQMQTESTYISADWDFVTESSNGTEEIWRLCQDGVSYPKLSWEFPTGDFVCDDGVDLADFAFFADYWQVTNCGSSNDCNGVDLDFSDTVNPADLKIFCDRWLTGL